MRSNLLLLLSLISLQLTPSGQLSVRHHLVLPQQKDPHLQRGVLHRHQPPHQEMQELQEETSRQRIPQYMQPHPASGGRRVSTFYDATFIMHQLSNICWRKKQEKKTRLTLFIPVKRSHNSSIIAQPQHKS